MKTYQLDYDIILGDDYLDPLIEAKQLQATFEDDKPEWEIFPALMTLAADRNGAHGTSFGGFWIAALEDFDVTGPIKS